MKEKEKFSGNLQNRSKMATSVLGLAGLQKQTCKTSNQTDALEVASSVGNLNPHSLHARILLIRTVSCENIQIHSSGSMFIVCVLVA